MSSGKLDCLTDTDIVLHDKSFLGRGAFATCHLFSIKSDVSSKKYVLKELHSNTKDILNGVAKEWITKRLQREIQLMHCLGSEREEFVKVLWLYINNGRFSGYGMEFCANGSLRQFIKRLECKLTSQSGTPEIFPFLTARWMLQVACGFDHLQTRQSGALLHLDLAVDNILVTSSLLVKIADFGLAKSITDSIASQNTFELDSKRTIERRVPEKYEDLFRQPDVFVDRYLYGICVVEAFTRLSLRFEIGDQIEEYKRMVCDGRHFDHFERLVDRRCFGLIQASAKDEQLRKLQSTVNKVIRLTAQQVPEKRAEFAELCSCWRQCDTKRMENERFRVLEMLGTDDEEESVVHSLSDQTVSADYDSGTAGSNGASSVGPHSSEIRSSSAEPISHDEALSFGDFRDIDFNCAVPPNLDTNDFTRDPPDLLDDGDCQYDPRDYLHDF